MTSEIPVIEVESWNNSFEPGVASELAKYLPSYIVNQRWYRAKAKSIKELSVHDALKISERDFMLVVQVRYPDESCALYLLPVSVNSAHVEGGGAEIIAVLRAGEEQREISASPAGKQVRDALLRAIACGETFQGIRGELMASHTAALGNICTELPDVRSAVSHAEQSNTSIIYGDLFILKLFRKVEPGINPDLEVGAFLTGQGFKHTPALLGTVMYHDRRGEKYAAGILQQFVKNQGDAWKYTLDTLGAFFERALPFGEQPALFAAANQHPLVLMDQPLLPEELHLLGPYLDSAELLGKRTAQMHVSLASAKTNPDFVAEPFSDEARERAYQAMISEADIAFETLRRKLPALSGQAAEYGRDVLRLEQQITARFAEFRERPVKAFGIRYHGDYHLGQVLFTGEDFIIIDFEGEPARPLAERRAKGFAMRDVAGMARSFEYAAFAALRDQSRGVESDSPARALLERWASFWNSLVTAAFLRAYFAEAGSAAFVPAAAGERRRLLDAFILQKACYEVSYELNNRPDWVSIPLRGILTLARQSVS